MSELSVSEVVYKPGPEGFAAEHRPLSPDDGLVMPESVDHEEYLKRVAEANEEYRRVRDSDGGWHELTVMNADKIENGILFRPSTSFSSITKNPAWMLESAYLAAVMPNVAHVSWSAFNNYATRSLTFFDTTYNMVTGRLTTGNGSEKKPYQAVDSVKWLVEMLDDKGLMPTHFIADQEAGRLVLPMMTAMPENSVKGVSLNGINGIAPGNSNVLGPVREDMVSRINRRRMGDGEIGDSTPANIAELKAAMPNIYHGWQKYIHVAPLTLALLRDDVLKAAQVVATMGRNNLDRLPRHAVYQDMRAALQNQDVRIDLQFNAKSSQHKDMAECIRFGKLMMDGLVEIGASENEQRGVRLLLNNEGTWSGNTDQPHETSAIRRLGLPGITRLSLLAGGLPMLRSMRSVVEKRHTA